MKRYTISTTRPIESDSGQWVDYNEAVDIIDNMASKVTRLEAMISYMKDEVRGHILENPEKYDSVLVDLFTPQEVKDMSISLGEVA